MPVEYQTFAANISYFLKNLMTIIKWTDDLNIGIVWIDNQHKNLVDRLDKLLISLKENHNLTSISSTLKFFEDYTKTHFSTEEKSMIESGYPRYMAHKKKHQEFEKTINKIRNIFLSEGGTTKLEKILVSQSI